MRTNKRANNLLHLSLLHRSSSLRVIRRVCVWVDYAMKKKKKLKKKERRKREGERRRGETRKSFALRQLSASWVWFTGVGASIHKSGCRHLNGSLIEINLDPRNRGSITRELMHRSVESRKPIPPRYSNFDGELWMVVKWLVTVQGSPCIMVLIYADMLNMFTGVSMYESIGSTHGN